LADYNSVEELLHPYGRVVILYYWKAKPSYYGHWVCCFRNGDNNIEVFNSFGGWIDDTLKQISDTFKKEYNQDYKYLTNLLYKHDGIIEYNNKQLQKKAGTSTCGRWCCYRMKRIDLNIEEFIKLFPNIKNNDLKIINLTL